ncbi:MAG: hypothetical protein Q4G05_03655 [Clostridia bacterium]|nr:hypothetical protein [Clostridia bacterium]
MEEEILEKMKQFIDELEKQRRKSLNQEEIRQIRYYEEFDLAKIRLENVFVVILEDEEKDKISEVYLDNPNKKIIRMNEKIDKVAIDENMDKFLELNNVSKDELVEYIQNLNEENLRAKVEDISKDEMTSQLQIIEKNTNNDEKIKIQNDLSKNTNLGEDLEITYYKKFIDDRFQNDFPEIVSGAQEVGIAYSEKLNAFICVTKTDKGFELADGTVPSRPTMRTVISIDENGEKIEKKTPYALIEMSDSRREISVNIEEHGYVEAEKIERTSSNQRIGRKVEGQGESKRVSKEIKDLTERGKNEISEIEEIAENYEENEKIGDKIQTIDDVQRNDEWIIDLDNGEQIIMKDEAQKARVSIEEFKKFFIEAEGKTPEEKLDNAHEDIEEYYKHPGRFRD